ncbi:hypothetical protein ACFPJ1_24185 [Kribbella qitaiheensis]|uniref:hypothetical protein n=1 Tax=Kribbella qitaiheensis TaxID=1544730 RepID=UPI0036163D9D
MGDVGVDVLHDGFRGGVAGGNGLADLGQPLLAGIQVEGEDGARVVDQRAVAGE